MVVHGHPGPVGVVLDPDDAATLGCLESIARRAWGASDNGGRRCLNVVRCSAGVSVILAVQPPGHPGQLPNEREVASSDTVHDALVLAVRAADMPSPLCTLCDQVAGEDRLLCPDCTRR